MTPGLRILRRISPSRTLEEWLTAAGHLIPIEDKRGKEYLYIDDDIPREAEITEEIVGRPGRPGCTDLFVILDDDNNVIRTFPNRIAAETALAGARVVFTTEMDVEGLEEAESDDDGADLPPAKGKH